MPTRHADECRPLASDGPRAAPGPAVAQSAGGGPATAEVRRAPAGRPSPAPTRAMPGVRSGHARDGPALPRAGRVGPARGRGAPPAGARPRRTPPPRRRLRRLPHRPPDLRGRSRATSAPDHPRPPGGRGGGRHRRWGGRLDARRPGRAHLAGGHGPHVPLLPVGSREPLRVGDVHGLGPGRRLCRGRDGPCRRGRPAPHWLSGSRRPTALDPGDPPARAATRRLARVGEAPWCA